MMVTTKAKVAYPASTDAELREKVAKTLRELATHYCEAAEIAMLRQDRHSVYEAVKSEREALNRAMKAEKGDSRF